MALEPTVVRSATARAADDVPFTAFLTAILVGCASVVAYALRFDSWDTGVAVVSVAFLVAGSALATGGVIGFLFGIPMTLRDERRPDERGGTLFRPNTNLEQISDWLTKILVGVGLTQIARLPDEGQRLIDFLSPGLGDDEASETFALALVIYFTIVGFLLVYLWTRVYLEGVLHVAEERWRTTEEKVTAIAAKVEHAVEASERSEATTTALTTAASHDPTLLALVDATLRPSASGQQPTFNALRAATMAASSTGRAFALLKAQEIRSSTWRDKKEEMARTIPIFRALAESEEGSRAHTIHGQLGFALKDQPQPDWKAAEEELTKAIELRGDWRDQGWLFYEFNRAAARTMLDEAFRNGQPSSAATREAIIADLRAVAGSDFLVELIERGEAGIKPWMELNQVKLSDLRS